MIIYTKKDCSGDGDCGYCYTKCESMRYNHPYGHNSVRIIIRKFTDNKVEIDWRK